MADEIYFILLVKVGAMVGWLDCRTADRRHRVSKPDVGR